MTDGPSLPLAELAILAVLSERPAHGFAIPRPVIYRSIGRLLEAGLVTPAAVESGRGPQRTLYTVTPPGREAAAHWLDTPVEHIRDVRSHLLLKLALLDRAGRDPTDLLRRQRAALEPGRHGGHAGLPRRHPARLLTALIDGAAGRRRLGP